MQHLESILVEVEVVLLLRVCLLKVTNIRGRQKLELMITDEVIQMSKNGKSNLES